MPKVTFDNKAVWPHSKFAVDGDTIWFVPYEYCYLYQYNYREKKVCRRIFLEDATSKWTAHYSVLKIEHYVVLIPGANEKIYIFDEHTQKLQTIAWMPESKVHEYFQEYAIWNKDIFFFPIQYENIVKLNLQAFSVEEIPIPNYNSTESLAFTLSLIQRENIVDVCVYGSNKIFRYDLKSNEGEYFVLGDSKEYYTICCYGKEDILLVDKGERAFIYDKDFNKLKEFNIPANKSGYKICKQYDNGYLFFPQNKEDAIYYYAKDRFIEIDKTKEREDEELQIPWEYNSYSHVEIIGKEALFFDILQQSLCIMNLRSFEREFQKIESGEINDDDKMKMFSLMMNDGSISEPHFVESNSWNLNDFINWLKGM